MKKINWIYCGKTNSILPIAKEIQGVYLWVYKNKRVIYVGTAYGKKGLRTVAERIDDHVEDAKKGKCTIFSPPKEQDVYALMSFPNFSQKNLKILERDELIKYHIELSQNEFIWIPSKEKNDFSELNIFYKDFYLGDEFYKEKWWDTGKTISFLENCEIWACKVEEEFGYNLETQLQIAFGNYDDKFKLVYCLKKEGRIESQNWLGKQAIKDKEKLSNCNFNFENFPKIRGDEIQVFKNLNDIWKEYFDKQWFSYIK